MTNETQGIVAAALADTFRALTRYERRPFMQLLANLLDCKPTPEAIRAFAEKSPDRWAQAVSIMAGLAGFDRGVGPTINVYNVGAMSDVELVRRLAELDRAAAAKDITPRPGEGAIPSEGAGQSLPPGAELQPMACEPNLGIPIPNVGILDATESPPGANCVAQSLGSSENIPRFLDVTYIEHARSGNDEQETPSAAPADPAPNPQ